MIFAIFSEQIPDYVMKNLLDDLINELEQAQNIIEMPYNWFIEKLYNINYYFASNKKKRIFDPVKSELRRINHPKKPLLSVKAGLA